MRRLDTVGLRLCQQIINAMSPLNEKREAAVVVRKIISGGQTGADQAALDVAIDFGISYGGWVPKGRKTENGPLDPKYEYMKESVSGRYGDRTMQNVVEADGTLIISHGKLTGGSRLTAQFAQKYGRPCLHVDLKETFRFKAAETIRSWVLAQRINVLNVAGPRASADPEISRAVYDILQTAFFMDMAFSSLEAGSPKPVPRLKAGPSTIAKAVQELVKVMPLRDKIWLARLSRENLRNVLPAVSSMMKQYGVWPEDNPELMADCIMQANPSPITPDEAPLTLLVAVWNELRQTHSLRRIK